MMQTEKMEQAAVAALRDAKAQDISVLDVRERSDFTDYMIVATGTSNRHVLTLADKVEDRLRALGVRVLGREGNEVAEWVVIDFGGIVVHLMRPQARAFYNLEKLWADGPGRESRQGG